MLSPFSSHLFSLTLLVLLSCSKVETPLLNSEMLQLNVISPPPYYADGVTTIQLEVELLVNTDAENRQIKFTADEGEFVEELVYFGSDNKAVVNYLPPVNPGYQQIKVAIERDEEIFVEKLIELVHRPTSSILSIQILESPMPLVADGNGIIMGTLSLNNYPGSAITLSTNGGEFIPSKKKELSFSLDRGQLYPFSVQVDQVATNYVLTASINETLNIDTLLSIGTSRPDSLFVYPSSYEIDSANGEVDIHIHLLKDPGKVSDDVPLTFETYQGSITNPVGRIKQLPVVSKDQKALAKFVLDTRRANPGEVDVMVKAVNQDGDPVSQTITLTVN